MFLSTECAIYSKFCIPHDPIVRRLQNATASKHSLPNTGNKAQSPRKDWSGLALWHDTLSRLRQIGMQKATFYTAKGRLLACKRRPFAMYCKSTRYAAGNVRLNRSGSCLRTPAATPAADGAYFTSQMSLVSSSSAKLWYFFLPFTSSICSCRAAS